MRRPSSIFVLFVLLAFGTSLAVPTEDVPETVYDESEGLPYEDTPLVSIVLSPLSARTIEPPLSSLRLRIDAPSPFTPARVHDTDAHRSGDVRISLALLCTLLC